MTVSPQSDYGQVFELKSVNGHQDTDTTPKPTGLTPWAERIFDAKATANGDPVAESDALMQLCEEQPSKSSTAIDPSASKRSPSKRSPNHLASTPTTTSSLTSSINSTTPSRPTSPTLNPVAPSSLRGRHGCLIASSSSVSTYWWGCQGRASHACCRADPRLPQQSGHLHSEATHLRL